MTSRRRFLGQLAAGAAGAVGLDRLLAAREQLEASWPARDVSWARLREDYLLDPRIIYFNHASIGTMPRAVHDARVEYLAACEGNPWLHMWGGVWEEAREHTRGLAAEVLGCGASDVAITHNTTEGFSLLAMGLPIGGGDEVVYSNLNHDGASRCWGHAGRRRGFRVRQFDVPFSAWAEMSEDDCVAAHLDQITDATRVLVLPHIDNTIGLRHPVQRIAAAARERGVRYVLVDGAQAVGMIPVDVAALGVDAYATSPHKWLQSPKGLGLLYLRENVREVLEPMWVTWGQSRWRGSVRRFEDYGTRNLPEVLALGDAIQFHLELGRERVEARLRELHAIFRDRVSATPRLRWRSPSTWGEGASLYALEVEGVAAGTAFDVLWKKHGCVFRAFGGEGLNTMRISPNVVATDAEIERFFSALAAEVLG